LTGVTVSAFHYLKDNNLSLKEEKMKKLITICAAIAVILTVNGVSFAANEVSYSTVGTGATATVTPVGVELSTAIGTGTAGSAYVRLNIDGGIALNAITSLSYTSKITTAGAGGFALEVVLNTDADGDATLEGTGIDWMAQNHNPATLGYVNSSNRGDNFLSGDNWPTSGGPDASFVNRDALGNYSYWNANDARNGFGNFWSPFSTIVPGMLPVNDIDGTDLVYSIDFVVGTSGNFDGMKAIVSSVKLNGISYSTSTPPTEVWVDDDYCEVCSNDGHTWGYDAFAVIPQGINAVAASGTVNVAPGDYNESLLVNKANLNFVGPNAGIPGSQTRSDEADIIGYVKIMSNGVSFNGFKFTDGAQVPAGDKAGIYIVGGTSGHTIQCNLFTRTGAAPDGPDAFRAIINEFGGVSSLQVKQNKFTGWHTGVYLQNADAQVTNNVMVENYVGMSIDGAVSVTVAYNSFIDNGLEGLGVGIPPLTSLTLEHNCFSGNPTAVANWQSIEINAEHNSWGDSTGPYNSISNPDGQGDAVSDNVDFDPWLPACCGDPLHLPPVGDLYEDCRVNFLDFAVFANAWLSSEGDGDWNQACNFEPKDNVIDTLDLRILADHWLECTSSECN
jgi:hypothetical protein